MASLFSAIRTSFDDSFWFFKLLISVGLLYYTLDYAPKQFNSPEILNAFYILVGLYFFGTGVVVMYRNINNIYPLYPSIKDILDIIIKTICGLLSIIIWSIISVAICYFSFKYTQNYFTVNSSDIMVWFQYAFYVIITIIAVSFVIVPLILYSSRGKIFDAYNLKNFVRLAGECIMGVVALLFQAAIVYGIIFACCYFFIKQVFEGTAISVNLAVSVLGVIFYYTSMIYFSNMYDLLPREDVELVIKKK